jgi:hypothetical protein
VRRSRWFRRKSRTRRTVRQPGARRRVTFPSTGAGEGPLSQRRARGLDHPGAAVPIRFDAVREPLHIEVQLVGDVRERRRQVKLEACLVRNPPKPSSCRRLGRADQGRYGAATASASQPDVQTAAPFPDQLDCWIRGEHAHYLMVARSLESKSERFLKNPLRGHSRALGQARGDPTSRLTGAPVQARASRSCRPGPTLLVST